MYSQWLNEQFKRNPRKKKALLAKALGLEAPAISKMLNGSRQLKAHELEIIKHFFGVVTPINISIDPHSGVYEHKIDSSGRSFHDSRKGEDGQWLMPGHDKNKNLETQALNNTRILKNSDDAMAPEFRNGEFVLVNTDDKNLPGVFMISDGFSQMIRYCENLPEPEDMGQIKISAHAKNFIPQILYEDDLTIMGRVVGKVQAL